MKCLIIIPSFYPAINYGGPIYSSYNACKKLSQIGVTIYVCTTNTNVNCRLNVKTGIYLELKSNFFVKYYNETVIGLFSLPLLFNLWRDIKKTDIVHIQAVFNSPVPIAFFYAKLFNKPIVYTPRGALASWGLKNKKSLWRMFL